MRIRRYATALIQTPIVEKWIPMRALLGHADVAVAPLVLWFCLLCVKHVLADFVWQPHWMAIGKERATGWFRPLLLHCLVHGACTMLLLLLFQPRLWFLALIDFAVHIFIDRVKGIILSRNSLTSNDRPFWTILGVDQGLHHLTGFMLAVIIASEIA